MSELPNPLSPNPLSRDTHKHIAWLSDLKQNEACWMPLDNAALIVVEGQDAQKFLQGQCTCDVNLSSDKNFLLGAHCNPQGRMLSSFTLLRLASEKFVLRLHRSIADAALADLKKYSIFSKANLTPGNEYYCFGVYSPQFSPLLRELGIDALEPGEQRIHACGRVLRLDNEQYELWFERTFIEENTALFAEEIFCAEHQWDLLNIRRGVAEIRTQTRAEFLPQELNFQVINGVSFKKGCYTGQEVIARIHYKGKLKKHMYRALIDGREEMQPGAQLIMQEKPVGSVVLCAPASHSAYEILAVCQDTAAMQGNVQSGTSTGGFLRWQTLPYAIPG